MATKTITDLERQIERVLREHLAAQREAAEAAVQRAFGAAVSGRRTARRTPSGRRAPAEMSSLAERLNQAVLAHPGETITVIAAEVGETPSALSRPMFHLKRAGMVRSTGERSRTRYFPTSAAKKAA